MKKKLALLLICCIGHTFAMESDISEKDSSDALKTMEKEICDRLEKLPMVNFLLKSSAGRQLLFTTRADKISTERVVSLVSASNCISSCMIYELTADCIVISEKFPTHRSFYENNAFRIFASNLAEIEEAFLQVKNIPKSQCLETTRILDMHLLRTIIERDHDENVRKGCANLLELLTHTHEKWPPRNHPVHAVSAFSCIKEALRKRQADKIDELDQSNLTEEFYMNVKNKDN